MSNSYYNAGSFPATGTPATSASMRAELALIAGGFDRLPTLSGNANKLVLINGAETGMTVLTPPAGDLVGTTATQTLTNKTISGAFTGSLTGAASLNVLKTGDTMSGGLTYSPGAANGVAYLNASKVLTSGSGLTFDGTALTMGANPTLSAGTANGILYLNGSKVATSGSALTYSGGALLNTGSFAPTDGTNIGEIKINAATLDFNTSSTAVPQVFRLGSAEQMRLTSTGLGIGTSSPATKLHISGTGTQTVRISTFTSGNPVLSMNAEGSNGGAITYDRATSSLVFANGGIDYATLDLFGNLGIGTSSPGARLDVRGGSLDIGLRYIETTTGNLNRIQLGAVAGAGYIDVTAGTGIPSLQLRVASATQATLDSFGNLGLGVTPSGWSGYRAAQIGTGASFGGYIGDVLSFMGSNTYNDNTNWRYIVSGNAAARYWQSAGAHAWYTAPSGTAGNPITFTQAMTLDASGNLGVGTSSPAARLDVRGWSYLGADSNNSFYANSTASLVTIGAAGRTSFSTSALAFITSNGTAALEQMRLDSSGNLGVGTTSPQHRLHTATAGNNYIVSQRTTANTSVLLLGAESGNTSIYSWTTVGGSTGVPLNFYTGPSVAMTLDASGNLGIVATPSAWGSTFRALQIARSSLFTPASGGSTYLDTNAYFDSVGYKYIANGFATEYAQVTDGSHRWYTAPSGTAGNAITFTQSMTLDASGNLGIGTSSPAWRVHAVSATDGRIQVEGSSGYGMVFIQGSSGNSAQLQLNSNGGTGRRYSIVSSPTGPLLVSDETAATTRVTLDASGNLGLSVTPGAWVSNAKALQIGTFLSAWQGSNGSTNLGFNVYEGGINTYQYSTTGDAPTMYQQLTGYHAWYTAPSGTAGNAISFTQAMTLNSAGSLGIGVTSPGMVLDVFSATNGIIQIRGGSGTNQGGSFFVRNAANTSTLCAFGDRARAFGGTPDQLVSIYTGSAALTFDVNGAERARITPTGNLTIGGTNDSARLRVEGTTDLTTGFQLFRSGTACANLWCSSGGALVFGLDGSAGTTEKARITFVGNQIDYQPAESAQNTSVTLTAANLQAQIITSNAAVTLTLPTGTSLEGYTTGMATDTAFEVTFIATTANAITIAANGNTTVGNLTVSGNTSGTFRFRKTATNTFTVYRIS